MAGGDPPACPDHVRPIGYTSSSTSSTTEDPERGTITDLAGDDAVALAETQPSELYKRILVIDAAARRRQTAAAVAALKHYAQLAVSAGDEYVLSFATQHGQYVVDFARGCPLDDVAGAFEGLLEWLRRVCLFDLERIVRQLEDTDSDTQPPTPQLGSAAPATDERGAPQDLRLGGEWQSPGRAEPQWRRRRQPPRRGPRDRAARRRAAAAGPAPQHADPLAPTPDAGGDGDTASASVSGSECSRAGSLASVAVSDPCAPGAGATQSSPSAHYAPRTPVSASGSPVTLGGAASPGGRGAAAVHGVPVPPGVGGARRGASPQRRRRPRSTPPAGADGDDDDDGGGGGRDRNRHLVSLWMSNAELPALRCSNAEHLYSCVFLDQGQLPNWVRVLGLQPAATLGLYKAWTHSCSLGPLPAHLRCYIIAMSGAVHRCDYWIRRGFDGFFAAGGDPRWTQGGEGEGVALCPKLRRFAHFLALLAHRPWDLGAAEVAALVQGGGWTLPELIHASIIGASALSHCCVANGLGIAEEKSSAALILGNQKLWSGSAAAYRGDDASSATRESFLVPMPAASAGCGSASGQSRASVEAIASSLNMFADDDLRATSPGGEAAPPPPAAAPPAAEADRYAALCPNDHSVRFPDEVMSPPAEGQRHAATLQGAHPGSTRMLKMTEYNWRDDASPLISSLMPDSDSPSYMPITELLEEEFTLLTEADSVCFTTLGPDAVHLPRMVFLYVFHLYKIHADDMDYSGINSLMDIEAVKRMKRFIKILACTPERVRHTDFTFDEQWARPAPASDKVRIAMIAAGARKQAALIHAMRAVSKFLAQSSSMT